MKPTKILLIIVTIGLLSWGGVYAWQKYSGNGLNFFGSSAGGFKVADEKVAVIENLATSSRQIKTTNDTKHSIELSELKSLGASKDETAPINDPKFVSISEASKNLTDSEPGIAVSIEGVNRFYPYKILVWHELVNDKIGKYDALVSYCPMCFSGSVYDRQVGDETVEFGSSGQLWQASPVFYDKKTDSNWSQILGEAIVGEKTGSKMRVLASDQVLFGDWKKKFPAGQVLSEDTGFERIYGENPYGEYDKVSSLVDDLSDISDSRLPRGELVLGLETGGSAKAYPVSEIKEKGKIEDEFAGVKLSIEYDKDLNVARAYMTNAEGVKLRIAGYTGFWFAWAGAYPKTEVYGK